MASYLQCQKKTFRSCPRNAEISFVAVSSNDKTARAHLICIAIPANKF